MNIIQSNIFDHFHKYELFLFTANSYVCRNRSLAMGKGIALQVKNKFKGIEFDLGLQVHNLCGHLGFYGVLSSSFSIKKTQIGAFQSKYHFKDPSTLELIHQSCLHLGTYFRNIKVCMNFPGICNGNLKYNEVLPIITKLDDNVDVYIK